LEFIEHSSERHLPSLTNLQCFAYGSLHALSTKAICSIMSDHFLQTSLIISIFLSLPYVLHRVACKCLHFTCSISLISLVDWTLSSEKLGYSVWCVPKKQGGSSIWIHACKSYS